MQVKVFNSVTEIGENQWNSIIGRNRIICSYNFLIAVEKSNINDCKYYYPVIYEDGKIVAHTCAYSITTDLDTIATGILKKIIQLIRIVWKTFLKIKFLECGSPVALGCVISFSDNIDKECALSLIIDCVENIAKENKISIIVFRDFYEEELSFYKKSYFKGYKRFNNLPNTLLKINWNSFNEYLENLRSHYRNEIKKNINKVKLNNIKIEIIDNFSYLAEDLQILWQNVYNQAKEYRREILIKEFFINIDKYLINKSLVILFKKNSNILGFALVLIDDDSLRFMFSGLDYTYNREYGIYFNCLYNVIKLAIEMKKKEIDMGLTSYSPKTNVGANIISLFGYLKYMNILINPIVTNLFLLMNPKIKNKSHSVFKEKS